MPTTVIDLITNNCYASFYKDNYKPDHRELSNGEFHLGYVISAVTAVIDNGIFFYALYRNPKGLVPKLDRSSIMWLVIPEVLVFAFRHGYHHQPLIPTAKKVADYFTITAALRVPSKRVIDAAKSLAIQLILGGLIGRYAYKKTLDKTLQFSAKYFLYGVVSDIILTPIAIFAMKRFNGTGTPPASVNGPDSDSD